MPRRIGAIQAVDRCYLSNDIGFLYFQQPICMMNGYGSYGYE